MSAQPTRAWGWAIDRRALIPQAFIGAAIAIAVIYFGPRSDSCAPSTDMITLLDKIGSVALSPVYLLWAASSGAEAASGH